MVSLRLRPLSFQRKRTPYPLNRRLDGSQSQCGIGTPDRSARSPVTVPIEVRVEDQMQINSEQMGILITAVLLYEKGTVNVLLLR